MQHIRNIQQILNKVATNNLSREILRMFCIRVT